MDPYGRAVAVPSGYSRDLASQPGENTATAMKSVVADPSRYDWETYLAQPRSEVLLFSTIN